MANLNFRDTYEPLDSEALNRLEKELDISFPPEYKEFLLKYNGGCPSADIFYIIEDAPVTASCIHRFLGIKPDGTNEIKKYSRNLSDRIPSDLLPIAYDPGSNLVCLGVSGSNLGKVYYWDHEAETEEPSYDNVYLIAHSFTDFLEGLTEAPEEELDELEKACREGNLAVVKEFLATGGDVEKKFDYDRSLIRIAAIYGQLDLIRLLVQHNAKIDRAIGIATQNGYAEVVEYLISQGADLKELNETNGDTLLMSAAARGYQSVIEVLLKHGVDINTKNKYGYTALNKAIWGNHHKIVEFLKKLGAE